MAAKIWIISDTHFGHDNIIKYCNRPFTDAQEMDEIMIARWNAAVRPEDHIYHLGDVAFGDRLLTVMPRLQGHKRLVLGNHDNHQPMTVFAKYFQKIMVWRKFDHCILTHVPIHRQSFGKASVNVHGHTHDRPAYGPEWMNVCVEHTNYAPVELDYVLAATKAAL